MSRTTVAFMLLIGAASFALARYAPPLSWLMFPVALLVGLWRGKADA